MSETVDHITTAKSILAAVANFKDYSSIYANILQPNNATNTSNNSNNNNNSSVPSTPSTSRGSSNDTKKQKKRCTCKAFTPTVGVYCVECKNEYKAQDDHENKLRARAARLGEALGGLSVVAYEVMRAFDFSDPRNAPPPCTDPEMYSRRLEHKLAAAIESMKRMAEGVIRDAFRPEQENIQGEVQRANKVKAAYEKRNNLIRELLATEKHFCEGLGVITDVWKPEMTAAGLVDPFTDDVLFKPIPAIKELSKELVQDFSRILARPLEKQNLGKVLCKKAHKFNVFKPSCLSQQDATAMIAKLSSNNTFKELQNKLKKSSQITQNLSEYIFTPAQRMTRYPLLLNGIIKATEKSKQ